MDTHPVKVGMSKSEVMNLWGKPTDITHYSSKLGNTTQWSYQYYTTAFAISKFVFFRDNKVYSVQQ
jgi:hypothetical protein